MPAGFLNSMRLKGIHLAMRTGMLAAETAFDAVRAGDTSGGRAEGATTIGSQAARCASELYPVRNVHQAFGYGLVAGAGVRRAVARDRRLVVPRSVPAHAGYERMRKLAEYYRTRRPIRTSPVQPGEDRSHS